MVTSFIVTRHHSPGYCI